MAPFLVALATPARGDLHGERPQLHSPETLLHQRGLSEEEIAWVRAQLPQRFPELEEEYRARVAARNAQINIVVADHDKFNKRAPVALGPSPRFDVFYTDTNPPAAIRRMLEQSDVDLVVVD